MRFPEDTSQSELKAVKDAWRKCVGDERASRTIIHNSDVKFSKIKMKDGLIDKLLLGEEE